MKIAVLWSRFGPYHLARLQGAAAVATGHGAELIGLEVASHDHYAWRATEGANGFVRRTLFHDRDYGVLKAGAIRQAVAAALDDVAPQAVAVNGWSMPEARAALAWCRRRAATAVLMSETMADDAPRTWWKERIKRHRLRGCAAGLVGGRRQAEYLESLGLPRGRVYLGYDAVDNHHFELGARRARQQDDALRRQRGLPPRFFFACTRFIQRKNVAGLLRGYAEYRHSSSTEPWGLVIAGGGQEFGELQTLAGALRLQDVIWPGFLQYDQLPVYYGLASAFVHAATCEPWGLVVNEAAASGLPLLIAHPVGARYELVEPGGNGLLLDPFSVADIARCLTQVASMSGSQLQEMGRRSSEIAAQWSPSRFGQGLWEAIEGARLDMRP